MLVLGFKRGEKAVLTLPDGEECIVQVTHASKSGNVRLGFEFPEDVQISRESILDRVKALETLGAEPC